MGKLLDLYQQKRLTEGLREAIEGLRHPKLLEVLLDGVGGAHIALFQRKVVARGLYGTPPPGMDGNFIEIGTELRLAKEPWQGTKPGDEGLLRQVFRICPTTTG